MKLTLTAIALFSIVCGLKAETTLTQGERDRALSELNASRKKFLDSVAGLSEAQWKFKPSDDVWSVAECAEHITLSEDLIFGLITKVSQGPADPSKRADIKVTDEQLMKFIVDRSHKAKAPEPLVPTHRWPTEEALLDHFKESRDKTIDFVRTTDIDLRDRVAPHPAFGPLDDYQWILLLSGHTERHTAQLNEVKANPQFPK